MTVVLLSGCGTSVPLTSAPLGSALARITQPQRATNAQLPAIPHASFAQPAKGVTVGRFDGRLNKGIDIQSKPGQPVLAARDGRVVIVTSALPAYGTMVVLKHDENFITAYAHIEKSLVSEKEVVRRGQPIAEMGKGGRDQVALHFEI